MDTQSPKFGMVMDFSDLKKIINHRIIALFDHALILFSEDAPEELKKIGEPFTNIVFVPYQPTSENLLLDFSSRIRELLPAGITLHSMRLQETANSFAEWFAGDNQ